MPRKTEQSVASRYEALISVSVAIDAYREEGLLSALSAELLRVIEFDFIGLSRYDEATRKVEWHLSRPEVEIERGIIDATKEETMSAWVYEHQKPMIIPTLDEHTQLHGKIKDLAKEGIQSVCAFPLT